VVGPPTTVHFNLPRYEMRLSPNLIREDPDAGKLTAPLLARRMTLRPAGPAEPGAPGLIPPNGLPPARARHDLGGLEKLDGLGRQRHIPIAAVNHAAAVEIEVTATPTAAATTIP
jgi:hypothetical protein